MRIKKWREGVLIVLLLFLVCALGFNEEEIEYEVPLKGQVTEDSCWAASLQMIILAYEGEVSQEEIAQGAGYSLYQSYGWDAILKAIEYWGFCVYPQMCLTPDGWRQMLNEYGPLWVVRRTGPNITHAVVLRGMSGESDNPSMYVNDPWPVGKGTKKNMSYNEFEKVYEAVEEENPGYKISILYYCYEEEVGEEK